MTRLAHQTLSILSSTIIIVALLVVTTNVRFVNGAVVVDDSSTTTTTSTTTSSSSSLSSLKMIKRGAGRRTGRVSEKKKEQQVGLRQLQTVYKQQNKKSKKKDKDEPLLKAIIDSLDEDYADIGGWVSAKYNDDDELVINYNIYNGPEECSKCSLAIFKGKDCDDLGSKFYDTDDDPFTLSAGSKYVTNSDGRAAGFFETDNGYDHKDIECKFVVLYDEDDSDDDSKKSGKKKKSSKIGCGPLVPEGKLTSYCD